MVPAAGVPSAPAGGSGGGGGRRMQSRIALQFAAAATMLVVAVPAFAAEPPVINLWPGMPPGDEKVKLDAEKDFTKPTDALIAGRNL